MTCKFKFQVLPNPESRATSEELKSRWLRTLPKLTHLGQMFAISKCLRLSK